MLSTFFAIFDFTFLNSILCFFSAILSSFFTATSQEIMQKYSISSKCDPRKYHLPSTVISHQHFIFTLKLPHKFTNSCLLININCILESYRFFAFAGEVNVKLN